MKLNPPEVLYQPKRQKIEKGFFEVKIYND